MWRKGRKGGTYTMHEPSTTHDEIDGNLEVKQIFDTGSVKVELARRTGR